MKMRVAVACMVLVSVLLTGCLILNKPPVASFTASQVADTLTLNFDASGSRDTDGQIVSYRWDFVGLGSAHGDKPSFTFPDSEKGYLVKLEVTDDKGAIACVEKEVWVKNPPPKIRGITVENLSDARCGQFFVCNWVRVFVNALDPAGLVPTPITRGVKSINIYTGDGRSFPGPVAQFFYKQGGQYTIRVVVTDNKGATTEAAKTIIIQECRLLPPQASLSPRVTSVTLGKTVTFTVTSEDPDWHCDWCEPCSDWCGPCSPCPCESGSGCGDSCNPCPPPSPCPSDARGIVRIHVVVEDPSGDPSGVTVHDIRCSSRLAFLVNFNVPGIWQIRGIVWDDDRDGSRTFKFNRSINVNAE